MQSGAISRALTRKATRPSDFFLCTCDGPSFLKGDPGRAPEGVDPALDPARLGDTVMMGCSAVVLETALGSVSSASANRLAAASTAMKMRSQSAFLQCFEARCTWWWGHQRPSETIRGHQRLSEAI